MSEQGHGHDYQKIIKTLKPKYSFVYEINLWYSIIRSYTNYIKGHSI